MSEPLIFVRVDNLPSLEAAATALAPDANIKAILDEGAAVIYNHIRTRFLQQVDQTGRPWPASKAAERRRKRGRGGGTLFDTGKLWRSLQLTVDNPLTRSIGTDVPYAKFHQFGTIKLPKRVFLGFGNDDIKAMEDAAIHRMAQVLGGG